ncbi:MAG: alanyl-tRNA editing protein [Polyangiaceae bacterium]|nr:alanyl-tRNA editing protein [Polyangiaceae bacterium]
MTGTTRLYFDDPLLSRFEARVIAHAKLGDWTSLVLDKTALYPEAGGQMADRGKIRWSGGEAAVVDVQVDDDGVVHHRLGGAELPPVGAELAGEIDMSRRRVHMALHTGQHMLSRGLLDEASAPTVSARLGDNVATIDLDVPALDESAVARGEALVNAVIDDDRPIRAFFPTASELAGLDLRRAPKVDRDVRVVDIDGFDISPCGGTHCTRTAQVGLVKVTGVERYKGKMRISFVAGARARNELGRARDDLAALARDLTCGASDVAGAVAKLRADLASVRDTNKRLGADLAARVAAELAHDAESRGDTLVVAELPALGVEQLRSIAGAVVARLRGAVVLASAGDEGKHVLISRHAEHTLDCGKTLKAIAAAAGGRGGGRPEHAEGKLPSGADVVALVQDALAD